VHKEFARDIDQGKETGDRTEYVQQACEAGGVFGETQGSSWGTRVY
jgi:hypothetical protein